MPDWLPKQKVNLGLDLRGGSYLLLEVDDAAYLKDQRANLVDEIRTSLRAEKIGYRQLQATDSGVRLSLTDAANSEKVKSSIRNLAEGLVVNEGEEGNLQIGYEDRWLTTIRQQLLAQSLQIVARRVDQTGTREPIIQRQGQNRILLQVPGLDNPEHLKQLLGRTAKMTFHLLDDSVSASDVAAGIVPPGTRILPGEDTANGKGGARKYPIFSRVILSGDALVDAHSGFDSQSGEAVVNFRFNQAGARKFGEVTSQNIGKPFAIVLDGKVITAPVIRSAILGGSGQISGSFTAASANDLSLLLRAGALPAPLKVIEERSVGPSLGADSINAGQRAFAIALGLVIVFMIAVYGLFGFFATLAMVVNAIIIFAVMSLLGATLTMPGIAGMVLTMGMAVDTNVLIYERMREEMRNGRTALASIDAGFRAAFGTIIDSHITTLSAAVILFYFGTGTVKGFGVTLSIGIVASLFTAVLVTRLMIVLWARRVKPKTLPI